MQNNYINSLFYAAIEVYLAITVIIRKENYEY